MATRSRMILVPALFGLLTLAAGCATTVPATAPGTDAAATTSATATGAGDAPDEPSAAGASALEVRDRMVAAMRRPGHVYHRVAQRRQDAGPFSNEGSISHWLDADAGLAREALRLVLDSRKAPPTDSTAEAKDEAPEAASDGTATFVPEAVPGKPDRMATAAALIAATQEAAGTGADDDGLVRGDKIVVGQELFDLDKDLKVAGQDAAPTCPGLNAAVSLVLGCRPGAAPEWTVEEGQYRGQRAILLTATYRAEGSPELLQVDHWYLDPATYLPWTLSEESVIRYGTAEHSAVRADYQHVFIPVDQLPPGIFDPQRAVEPTPRQ